MCTAAANERARLHITFAGGDGDRLELDRCKEVARY